MKHLLCLFLFLQTLLNADPNAPTTMVGLPFADTEAASHTIIGGRVNAISGSYIAPHYDFNVPSCEPISFVRIYTDNLIFPACLQGCWTHNFRSEAICRYQELEEGKVGWGAEFIGPMGQHTLYSKITRGKKGIVKLDLADHPHNFAGLTNIGSDLISGQTNIKNHSVQFQRHDNEFMFKVTSGSGHKYYLNELKTAHIPGYRLYTLKLTQEQKPNGNHLIYEYDSDRKLKKVKSVNNKQDVTFGEIHFSHAKPGDPLKISGSNGNYSKYYFDRVKLKKSSVEKQFYISKVERSDAPTEEYFYVNNQDATCRKLSKISYPEGRFLEIDYCMEGEEWMWNRVKALKAPVGNTSEPITTYSFKYKGKEQGRKTIVSDAYNHVTIYRYDSEPRLSSIERYTGTGIANWHSGEVFHWASNHKDRTNLVSHVINDTNHKAVRCRSYIYDPRGNTLSEQTWGNLTGKPCSSIRIGGDNRPENNGCEFYWIIREYSEDEFNLVTAEKDPFGKHTRMNYVPKTNLLASKITTGNSQLPVREFFEYDKNAVLIKQIQDDGDHDDVNDLTGVTTRLITYVTPKSTGTCIGMPVEIQECCLDLSTKAEHLLKRVVLKYDNYGHTTQKDLYDANNQLQLTTYWEYNAHGHVTKEWNSVGQVVSHKYDANGNCIYTNGPHSDVETLYTYDFSNRMTKSEERHADGQVFVQTFEYNFLSEKVASVDIYGNKTRYEYDDFGKLSKVILPETIDENGAAYHPSDAITYDVLGAVASQTDAKGRTTQMLRNTVWGKPAEVVYPDGTREHFEYATDGKLVKKVEKNGTIINYTYDPYGRKILAQTSSSGKIFKTESWNYNALHLISETDGNGNLTEYTYDAAGRKKSMTQKNPGGQDAVTQFEYDALGRLHKTIQLLEQDASVSVVEYDVFDQVIEELLEDIAGNIFHKKGHVYDLHGNCVQTITYHQNNPAITTIAYDSRGNPISIIDALGNATHIAYDYAFLNAQGYNVLQKTTTDPNGVLTIETYDVRQKLASVEKRDAFGTLLSIEELRYDRNGNLAYWNESVVLDGQKTIQIVNRKQYGPGDRVETVIEAEGTPDQKIVRYTYNAFGQQATLVKPDGVILQSTYDPEGHMSSYVSSDGSIDYAYTYDRNHNLISILDRVSGTTTSRKYDVFDRVIEETLGNNQTLSFKRDSLGRGTQIELPDRSCIRYRYDGYLRVVARHDANGNQLYAHSYTDYDLAGDVLNMQLPGAAGQIKQSYDALGQRTSTLSPQWQESVKVGGYDPVGNLLSSAVDDAYGNIKYRFTYDALNQLENESGHVTHKYKNDSLNNCVSKDDVGRSHNARNQLLTAGNSRYTYDINGNLIQQIESGDVWKYTYDALDRLVAVTHHGETFKYTYDHFHRRLSKEMAVGIEDYLYVDQDEIGSCTSQGIQELRILGRRRGAEIGATVAIEKDEKVYVPIHNMRGDICSLVDEKTGQEVQTYRYSAFGEQTVLPGGESIISWGFSSKRFDPETGFVYFGRRYYAPHLGRWITPDPLGLADGPNLYAYVHNNPLTHNDLYGLFTSYNFQWQRPSFNRGYSSSSFSNMRYSSTNFSSFQSQRGMWGRTYDRFSSVGYAGAMGYIHPIDTLSGYASSIASYDFRNRTWGQVGSDVWNNVMSAERFSELGGVALAGVPMLGLAGKAVFAGARGAAWAYGGLSQITAKLFTRKAITNAGGNQAVTRNPAALKAIGQQMKHLRQAREEAFAGTNLASVPRTNHILYGEGADLGGHLTPGAINKTAFPKSWGPDKIMHYISDIATDPSIKLIQQTGISGARFTNKGYPVKFIAEGVRENVRIRVVLEQEGRGIVTAFPF